MPVPQKSPQRRSIVEAYPDEAREAQAALDARDRWRTVATAHNKLVARIRRIHDTHGNVRQLITNGVRDPAIVAKYREHIALEQEIAPLRAELRALSRVPRAGQRETLVRATTRILVERGLKPTQIAKATRPDRASAERSETSERVTAHNIREKRREQFQGRLDELIAERVALNEPTNVGKLSASGDIEEATLADINPEYASQLDAAITRMKESVAVLSSRPIKKSVPKPAKRRRNRNV